MNTVWLVAGNKGGVGKSLLTLAFCEWIATRGHFPNLVDGDIHNPDVAVRLCTRLPTTRLDLHQQSGWENLADWLYQKNGQVVGNLPDGLNENALKYFSDFADIANSLGFETKLLFCMNTLSEGLQVYKHALSAFDCIPVKNLYFGKPSEFVDFDQQFDDQNTVLIPKLNKRSMLMFRNSSLSINEYINQRGNSISNSLFNKYIIQEWLNTVFESLNEILREDI